MQHTFIDIKKINKSCVTLMLNDILNKYKKTTIYIMLAEKNKNKIDIFLCALNKFITLF